MIIRSFWSLFINQNRKTDNIVKGLEEISGMVLYCAVFLWIGNRINLLMRILKKFCVKCFVLCDTLP